MMERFHDEEFCIMPFTYILPRDMKKLRAYLSVQLQTVRHVILKPVRGHHLISQLLFVFSLHLPGELASALCHGSTWFRQRLRWLLNSKNHLFKKRQTPL